MGFFSDDTRSNVVIPKTLTKSQAQNLKHNGRASLCRRNQIYQEKARKAKITLQTKKDIQLKPRN
jgi:hypothetical protein